MKMSIARDTTTYKWMFTLYFREIDSLAYETIENFKTFADEHLGDSYEVDVINLKDSPMEVVNKNIISLPLLVRESPNPARRIVGDLSDFSTLFKELKAGSMPLPLSGNK